MNKTQIRTTIITTGIFLLIVVGLYAFYSRSPIPYVDVPREKYPICGIDLSAHNGVVNFDSVAANGIDFVLLKASEGTSFRDSLFNTNYDKARQAGLKVGAYHFFRFDSEGSDQANNVLNAIKGMPLDFPIAIDIEEWGNMENFTTTQIIGQLQEMIDTLENNGGKVMIYTNKKGFNRFIRSHFEHYPLWICSFTNPPIDATWDYWQHSHISKIAGIQGDVDLNTFNGSHNEWLLWIDKHHMVIPRPY